MDIKVCYLTKNNCYKLGQTITPKGIMVHSTGANNPNLRRHVQPDDGILGVNLNGNHWNQPKPGGASVCVHAFIGRDKNGTVRVYQTLPWNMRGWHCGGPANNTHIGFEICEDGLSDPAYFAQVYQEAVELCVHLCRKYGLTEKNIICHSEGAKMGIASNHGDVMHWFPRHGKSMDTFRAAVKAALAGGTTATVPAKATAPAAVKPVSAPSATAVAALSRLKTLGVIDAFDYWKEHVCDDQYLDDLVIKASAKLAGAAKTKKISSVSQALSTLAAAGAVKAVDYWRSNCGKVKYLDQLLIDIANAI